MKNLSRTFFISLVAAMLFINSAWAEERIKRHHIDSEKALDIFLSQPDIKFIFEKCKCGSSSCLPPTEDRPYFMFSYAPESCINYKGPCEGMGVFTCYMDADTGRIWCDESVKEEILAIKESERRLAESIKNERPLEAELKKVYVGINENRLFNKGKYMNLIQSNILLFLKALNAVTPDIRSEGARILGQLSNYPADMGQYKVKEAIPKLLELLKDDDYGVRYEVVWALGNIGERGDNNLVESILPLIKDSDSLVRRGTIEALAKLGDNSLVPTFIELLEDTSVNQEVVKAFTHIGDERAVGPLIRLFNNKEYFYLERDIIYTLGAIGGKESILALMNLFNKRYTPDKKFGGSFEPLYPYMGADVAKALVNIGKDSEPYLIESLKSQDYLERLYAAYALSLLKNTSAVEHLNRALKTEENPTVKIYLEMAIAEIQGKEFISPLLQQLKIWTEPSKKKYSANETISVYLYLQNKGTIPFTINAVPLEYADLALEIFDPEGKPAINPIIEFCRTTFPTKDSLITLAPGKVHKFGPYHLQDFYRFDRKGKYRIIGVYANSSYACGIEFGVYALTGKVESEQAIIEIK